MSTGSSSGSSYDGGTGDVHPIDPNLGGPILWTRPRSSVPPAGGSSPAASSTGGVAPGYDPTQSYPPDEVGAARASRVAAAHAANMRSLAILLVLAVAAYFVVREL